MNRHLLPSAELRELAELQSGVLTREQALAHGLIDRTLQRIVTEGWWQRLRGGVFHTSAAEPGWRSLAWAGVLVGGDQARLHGPSAAFELRLVREAPYPIDIAVTGIGTCAAIIRGALPSPVALGIREGRCPGPPPKTPCWISSPPNPTRWPGS